MLPMSLLLLMVYSTPEATLHAVAGVSGVSGFPTVDCFPAVAVGPVSVSGFPADAFMQL